MTMGPYFLDLALDKYEVCCAVQHGGELCECDASEELVAHHPDGTTLYIPICQDKLHRLKAIAAKRAIEGGASPSSLTEVSYHGIFLQPQGLDRKCKSTEWDRFSMSVPEVTVAPKKKPVSKPAESSIPVPAKWSWVDKMNYWMDADGQVKRLRDISKHHLILTAIAIRDSNYQSCPKKISWTKNLISPNFKILYPEDKLQVGAREAGSKLEEFEEALTELGCL